MWDVVYGVYCVAAAVAAGCAVHARSSGRAREQAHISWATIQVHGKTLVTPHLHVPSLRCPSKQPAASHTCKQGTVLMAHASQPALPKHPAHPCSGNTADVASQQTHHPTPYPQTVTLPNTLPPTPSHTTCGSQFRINHTTTFQTVVANLQEPRLHTVLHHQSVLIVSTENPISLKTSHPKSPPHLLSICSSTSAPECGCSAADTSGPPPASSA